MDNGMLMLCVYDDDLSTRAAYRGNCKGNAKRPYYRSRKSIRRSRKSIRRDKIEGEIAELFPDMTPRPELFALTKTMFSDAWAQRTQQA